MPTLGIDREFLQTYSKLQPPVQRRVTEVFEKFGEATHAGVHLERIANVRDDRLRSIRIDQSWRGIVLAPESGDTYTLLTVLPHDDAYAWAQRRRFTVNRSTGVIEVRDVAAIEEELPRLRERAAGDTGRLLGHVKDADLIRLGVDEQVRAVARTLTAIDQLDALRGMLPGPQYDVLLGLASGMTPEEVWAEVAPDLITPGQYDTEDVAAAVERSTDRVVLVSGPDDLMEVFAYPLARWRVFLHPQQRKVAYGSYRGPARVTGGPGTGKTVVALHRAKHLAAAGGPPASILLTTFTRTLADSLDTNARILIEDDQQLARIDIRGVDQLAHKVVTAESGRLRLLSPEEEKRRWQAAAAAHEVDAAEAFLGQEWRQVLLAQDITDLDDYRAAVRGGRGRPLDGRRRATLWPVFEDFRAGLTRDRVSTYETVCVEAARILNGRADKPYRHVIVDEAQDLAPWQWRMLRAAVAKGPDDLFLAGDTHQRIYANRVSLRTMGIDVAGRSARLVINYRTTAEILGWSIGLLRGERIDDLDSGLEVLAGCRSEVHGRPPVLAGFPTRAAELDRLVHTVEGWLGAGVEAGQIGVAARSSALADHAMTALCRSGVPAQVLTRAPGRTGGIAITTMHRMKGLEFQCVAVVGVGEHQIPAPSAVTPADEDPLTHDLDIQRERCLLFVACTRAREELAISWHGNPSPLLVDGGDGLAILRT